jgi:fatty acid desaturase
MGCLFELLELLGLIKYDFGQEAADGCLRDMIIFVVEVVVVILLFIFAPWALWLFGVLFVVAVVIALVLCIYALIWGLIQWFRQ